MTGSINNAVSFRDAQFCDGGAALMQKYTGLYLSSVDCCLQSRTHCCTVSVIFCDLTKLLGHTKRRRDRRQNSMGRCPGHSAAAEHLFPMWMGCNVPNCIGEVSYG